MEVQQKAIKSIQSDTLIFNYPVRKQSKEEQRTLQIVLNTRKLELKEKLKRLETGLKEALDEQEFSAMMEPYLMNRVRGKPLYEDDDSIALATEEFQIKDMEKKAKKEKMEQNISNQANPNQVAKKQP